MAYRVFSRPVRLTFMPIFVNAALTSVWTFWSRSRLRLLRSLLTALSSVAWRQGCRCLKARSCSSREGWVGVVAEFVEGFVGRGMAPGVQVPEGQVLQFAVGLVQPQAVGDGGVD